MPAKSSAKSTKLKTVNGRHVSAKSKTGDPQCSAAMSAKVNARLGNPVSMALSVANAILGKCRSMAHHMRRAADHRLAGHEGIAQTLEHRTRVGVDRYLTPGQRAERAKQLRAERAGRRTATARPAGPSRSARTSKATPKAPRPRFQAVEGRMKTENLVDRLRFERRVRTTPENHLEATDRVRLQRMRRENLAAKATRQRPESERSRAAELVIRTRGARAPKPAEKPFTLAQQSAHGRKATGFADTGGRTGTMFDMKRGDLPGQTSLLDKVGTVKTTADRRTFGEQVMEAAHKVPQSGRFGDNKVFIHHVHREHQKDIRNPRMSLDQFKYELAHGGNGEHRAMLSRADLVQAMNPADVAKAETKMFANQEYGSPEWHFVRLPSKYDARPDPPPVSRFAGKPAPTKAPGRNTPERAGAAKRLLGLRKQLNSVRADLRFHNSERQAKLEAKGVVDESRADRLNEQAHVRKKIGEIRGKTVRRSTVHLSPRGDAEHAITAVPLRPQAHPMTERGSQARLDLARRIRGQRSTRIEHAHPETHGKTGGVYQMATDRIHFDPDRFQYKLAAQGAHGVTDALKGVKKFDPELAGTISVWRDPSNGQTYVVNGHHRLDLARKMGVSHVSIRYLDAANHVDARAKGALVNIAEGRGNSVDAAKFFRDRGLTKEQAEQHGIPMQERIAHEGLAMAGLHESIFKRVVNHEMTPARAAVIGGSGLSHEQQIGLMKSLDKPKFRNASNGTVKNLIDIAKHAPTKTVRKTDLFGTTEEEESLALHRATLEDKIKRKLASDQKLFGLVSKSKAAEELAGRGRSHIDLEATGRESEEARAIGAVFDQMKHRAGELSHSLNRGAERLHAKEKAEKVFHEHYKEAREHIKRFLASPTF